MFARSDAFYLIGYKPTPRKKTLPSPSPSPPPPLLEEISATRAAARPLSLLRSHSYQRGLPSGSGAHRSLLLTTHTHGFIPPQHLTAGIYQGHSLQQLHQHSYCAKSDLDVLLFLSSPSWMRPERKVGTCGRLLLRKRTRSESCFAQNLRSLTTNLRERGSSPSRGGGCEWRAECERYCPVLDREGREGVRGGGRHQSCVKSPILHKYRSLGD